MKKRYYWHGENSVISKLEKEAVKKAIRKANGNRALAAKLLGVSERTIYRMIKRGPGLDVCIPKPKICPTCKGVGVVDIHK